MTKLRQRYRIKLCATALACALLVSACGELEAGIEAFNSGDFHRAISLLKSIAQKESKRDPLLPIAMDEGSTLEEVLPAATLRYFQGWHAYAGSLIGLDRIEEGCYATQSALRPISFVVNDQALPEKVDPRTGSFWQYEVFNLRSWWVTLDCEELLSDEQKVLN